MAFEIIEDCSPFYIRFTHEGIEQYINYVKTFLPNDNEFVAKNGYEMYSPGKLSNEAIVNACPISKYLQLSPDYTAFLFSKPNFSHTAHKDGKENRFNINYSISIKDENCITSWYSDEELKQYQIANSYNFKNDTRNCLRFDRSKHTPLKSMIAKPNEVVLFNTDIFHDFYNNSINSRILLSLKLPNPIKATTYFKDARKALFGY